jgi:hypothetical protein
LSSRLVYIDKAWQILAPLLQDYVKLLPLQCESGNYIILKPQIIDCLDRSLTVIKRFDDSDHVMHVVSYAFKTEIIKDKHFFTIPEAFAYNFVSQTFKDCVEANGLEGLIFRKIA